MEFKVTLSHPEDELHGDSVAQSIYWGIEEYIQHNGHLSNYDASEWEILVEEIS